MAKKKMKLKDIPTRKGEKWKYVRNTNRLYAVSSLGRVFSFHVSKRPKGRPGFITTNPVQNGYCAIIFSVKGGLTMEKVHRTVAKHFIPNPKNLPYINHKNLIRFDNRVLNLEWCDHDGNTKHAKELGVYKKHCHRGEKCHNSKYTELLVKKIRKEYERDKNKYRDAQRRLARKYNIDHRQIWKMVHRYTWTHI